MSNWAQSLIRISNYEVETLQKRLAEITSKKASAEMRLAVLDAEADDDVDFTRWSCRSGSKRRSRRS